MKSHSIEMPIFDLMTLIFDLHTWPRCPSLDLQSMQNPPVSFNVRRKFQMSGESVNIRRTKCPSRRNWAKCLGKKWDLAGHFKMSCKCFLFHWTWIRRNLKMSGEGPMVRRSKCPAKLKMISHTLDLHAKNQVCTSARSPTRVVRDRLADSKTHNVKTITSDVSQTRGVITESQ